VGQKHGDDAYVFNSDESKTIVQEISFRVAARTVSHEIVQRICRFATDLKWVLLTSEYEILAPDESMVLADINCSTAKRFVDDPTATLQGLDQRKMEKRIDHITKNLEDIPPK
jgi:hypothetical protein